MIGIVAGVRCCNAVATHLPPQRGRELEVHQWPPKLLAAADTALPPRYRYLYPKPQRNTHGLLKL
jgi:hypothetical protein